MFTFSVFGISVEIKVSKVKKAVVMPAIEIDQTKRQEKLAEVMKVVESDEFSTTLAKARAMKARRQATAAA